MAVSAYQADGVVITEVVESHAGQVGQSGEEDSQVRLPVRLGQLKQKTESFLIDFIGLQDQLGDLSDDITRVDNVLEHQLAPVIPEELFQGQLRSREECFPGSEEFVFVLVLTPDIGILTIPDYYAQNLLSKVLRDRLEVFMFVALQKVLGVCHHIFGNFSTRNGLQFQRSAQEI